MAKTWEDFVKGLNNSDATFTNPVIAEAQAQVMKENSDKMTGSAKSLLNLATNWIQSAVTELRNYRKLEADLKKKLEETNRALEYFGETGNPFPLYKATGTYAQAGSFCRTIGIDSPGEKDEVWNIPSSWKSKAKK